MGVWGRWFAVGAGQRALRSQGSIRRVCSLDEGRGIVIAERRTYQVKQGQWRKMVDLIKAEMKAVGPDIASRIYRPLIAPLGAIVHEMEFKDLTEREKFWAKWQDERATPEFWEKWNELFGQSGNVEVWFVE